MVIKAVLSLVVAVVMDWQAPAPHLRGRADLVGTSKQGLGPPGDAPVRIVSGTDDNAQLHQPAAPAPGSGG